MSTNLSVPVGSIPNGLDWQEVQSKLLEYLQNHVENLPIGTHQLEFVSGDFRLPLKVERRTYPQPGHRGHFFVSRQWPGASNENIIAKAFGDKLPKLLAAQADLRVLLFEQDSVAGNAFVDTQQCIESGAVERSQLPLEIWLLWTAALESEQYAHSALIYPDGSRELADWNAGTVTSNYPR